MTEQRDFSRQVWRLQLTVEDFEAIREDKMIPIRVPPSASVSLFMPVEFKVPGKGILIGTVVEIDPDVAGGPVAKIRVGDHTGN